MQVIFASALASALLLSSFCCKAADIREQELTGSDGVKLITVTGELRIGDEKQFTDIALRTTRAVVAFNSPGGAVAAAIQIGKAIRLEGFVTVVLPGGACTSACALAWLGGVARYMASTSMVGFHAAYTDASGAKKVSSVANALIGGYLNGLGYSDDAIAFFTSASPEDVQWLTFEQSARLGVEVRNLDEGPKEASSVSPILPPENARPRLSKAMRAKAFVREMVAASESNDLEDFLQYYGPKVIYFGKLMDKSKVAAEYDAYIRRWPKRRFHVSDEEMSVSCDDVSRRCAVSMVLLWYAESTKRAQRSEGRAKRSLVLEESGDGFVVLGFDESVLTRNVTSLANASRNSAER